MNIVEKQIDKVVQLCKKYKVKTLYLFGSVLTDRFTDKSDVDFLVNFGKVSVPHYFDNYIGFKEKLESLLLRPVDLLEEKAIRNPVLRRSIDRNKQLVYGINR